MATEILAQISKAFQTPACEFVTFRGLSPTVSAEILDNLLRVCEKETKALGLRIHYISPYGYLRVVMASRLHETSVSWMRTERDLWVHYGILSPISAIVSISDALSAYSGFVGNWANSTKTPDLCYSPRIDGVPTVFPTIVLESGWSESQTHLENDCKLWLEGSAGAVKVVLLYKLFEPNVLNEIKVTLHVCRIVDGAVVITLFKVFPPPAEPVADPFITAAELFGGRYPNGFDPQTVFPLSLTRLRYSAGQEIISQGSLPCAH